MKLAFRKGRGKYDLLQIDRPGAAPSRVDCPKQRIIPHDMLHYAVERVLGARGFLARVKGGEAVAVRMEPEAASDAVERLVEVFQGDEWSGRTSSAADIIAMYRVTCEARKCPVLPLDASSVEAVRSAIAELTHHWNDVPVGGSMHLEISSDRCGNLGRPRSHAPASPHPDPR